MILQGEWWRILSGNFTHTNLYHLAMNIAGLWVITYLFKPSGRSLLLVLLWLALFIGISIFISDMERYVGLSGALHGIFAFYALTEALHRRYSSWLLVAAVLIKVIWEQLFGPSLSTAELIDANVAVDAHLLGLSGGVLLALLCYTRQQFLIRDKQ